jgi:hypothetical protein
MEIGLTLRQVFSCLSELKAPFIVGRAGVLIFSGYLLTPSQRVQSETLRHS